MKKATIIITITIIMLGILFLYLHDPVKFRDLHDGAMVVEARNTLIGLHRDERKTWRYVLEEDNYGREMYIYCSNSSSINETLFFDSQSSPRILALLIMQKSDTEFVYYYEDINFLSKKISYSDYHSNLSAGRFTEFVYETFLEEEINLLKEKNDWNKPLDESKCVKKRIIDLSERRTNQLVPSSLRTEIYNRISECKYQDEEFFLEHLTSDDYDRHIYFFRTTDEKLLYIDSYLVMIIQGKTYEIVKLVDLINFQQELSVFKSKNNWGIPSK